MVSPPDNIFTSGSAMRRPSSVSTAVTNRAPRRRARSFGIAAAVFPLVSSVSAGVCMA